MSGFESHGGASSVASTEDEQEHLHQAEQPERRGDASYHGDDQGAKDAVLHGRNHRAACALAFGVMSQKGWLRTPPGPEIPAMREQESQCQK